MFGRCSIGSGRDQGNCPPHAIQDPNESILDGRRAATPRAGLRGHQDSPARATGVLATRIAEMRGTGAADCVLMSAADFKVHGVRTVRAVWRRLRFRVHLFGSMFFPPLREHVEDTSAITSRSASRLASTFPARERNTDLPARGVAIGPVGPETSFARSVRRRNQKCPNN